MFEEDRSNVLALPIFCCVFSYLGVAVFLFRGHDSDTATTVVRILMIAAAVASTILLLRWRRLSLATLTIEHDRIVRTPRTPPGGRSEPQVIVRRPDSRLRTEIASTGSNFKSIAWWVLFDVAVKQPRVKIENFGRDRVKKACTNHGWVFAEGEKH